MKTRNIILIVCSLLLLGFIVYFFSKTEDVKFRTIQLNKMSNSVTNNTIYEYYDTILYIGLNKLNLDNIDLSVIPLSEEAKRDFANQGGDLTAHLREFMGNYYLYIDDISKNKSIEVLSHELIHLQQYDSGILSYKNDTLTWKGQKYSRTEIPYDNRPWENEAFDKGNVLSSAIEKELIED